MAVACAAVSRPLEVVPVASPPLRRRQPPRTTSSTGNGGAVSARRPSARPRPLLHAIHGQTTWRRPRSGGGAGGRAAIPWRQGQRQRQQRRRPHWRWLPPRQRRQRRQSRRQRLQPAEVAVTAVPLTAPFSSASLRALPVARVTDSDVGGGGEYHEVAAAATAAAVAAVAAATKVDVAEVDRASQRERRSACGRTTISP